MLCKFMEALGSRINEKVERREKSFVLGYHFSGEKNCFQESSSCYDAKKAVMEII